MKKTTTISLLLALPFFAFPQVQNALSFDGIDDKVDIGNSTDLQITGTQITLEAWIYPTSWRINVWEGGIVVKEQNNINNGYMFRAGNNGRLNFSFGANGGPWTELVTVQNTLSLNTWQHVAATYDGSKVRLYVNGLAVDSLSATGTIGNATNNCVIGGYYDPNRNFPGQIDEVRIWNIPRSPAEIAASMYAEFCSPQTGLVAYYKFNQGTANGNNTGQTTLYDQLGNNDGTLLGFALNGMFSNWVAGAPISSTVSTPGNMTAVGCQEYVSPSGKHTWTSSGTYSDTLDNGFGCDSVITIALTVNSVDVGVQQNGTQLSSLDTGAAYQWLDCNDGYAILPGETNQTFVATVNGSYAVQVSRNGCTDTSTCFTIDNIGLDEASLPAKIAVYPNPASKHLHIDLHGPVEKAHSRIYSLNGSLLYEEALTESNSLKINLPHGIYILVIEWGQKVYHQKLMVE